jgi:hypothetical protein
MLAFFRFEAFRIFAEKKNLAFFALIALSTGYFAWSGVNEYRRSLAEKKFFVDFEKEKTRQIATYAQYGTFGFRILYETAPLNLFFINSSILQDLESNIDNYEAIRIDSSFKGDKLFLMRGYFKDFAGILLVFGSLLMLYLGHLALVSPPYLRFLALRMPLARYFFLTTAARLFWLDLLFLVLIMGLFVGVQAGGIVFSGQERGVFLCFSLFLVLLLDFIYLLGQLTTVLIRFRKTFFLWFFVVWFACIFLLPELSRISVFRNSQSLEPAEKINLEKFRNLMAMEQEFRDYLKANPRSSLDQVRQMQKEFAVQFINSSYLVNTGLEMRYFRQIENVIAAHERRSVFFPTTYYQFLSGEASGKGYHGYLEFMDYIMKLRNRFMQFYLKRRYLEPDSAVESFVKGSENIFRSRSRLPRSFVPGVMLTALYCAALLLLAFLSLQRQVGRP